MKIAQIAPLYESVPPKFYGGTERVVSYLTEELVASGHDVTLFASEDSHTLAHFDPVALPSLRLGGSNMSDVAAHYMLLEKVMRRADEFDALHFHVDFLHCPFTRRTYPHHLATLHGRLDLLGLNDLYCEYWDEPVVSISDSQRLPLREALWIGTVYHGLPVELYKPSYQPGEYLAFLGRISPEKGPIEAIAIAERAGMKLKIAAKIDPVDQAYYEAVVKPRLSSTLVEFVGEVDEAGKNELLAGASALVFPIRWPEPFGLVMIEAMACGTPVVAYNCGSVPEVIDEGVTGFVVEDEASAVAALDKIGALDRRIVRSVFERRFSAKRMARDYVELYRYVSKSERSKPTGAPVVAREELA